MYFTKTAPLVSKPAPILDSSAKMLAALSKPTTLVGAAPAAPPETFFSNNQEEPGFKTVQAFALTGEVEAPPDFKLNKRVCEAFNWPINATSKCKPSDWLHSCFSQKFQCALMSPPISQDLLEPETASNK